MHMQIFKKKLVSTTISTEINFCSFKTIFLFFKYGEIRLVWYKTLSNDPNRVIVIADVTLKVAYNVTIWLQINFLYIFLIRFVSIYYVIIL